MDLHTSVYPSEAMGPLALGCLEQRQMNFEDFKVSRADSPTSGDICDPCLLTPRDATTGFSDDDQEKLLKLRWGFCPRCDHKVSEVLDTKNLGIVHYTCEKHTLHYYEVDYTSKTITML